MAVTPRLDLRQSQALVMTPQLQQAIKLLQLSNLELAAYVEGEMEQNPLLVRDEGGEDDSREQIPAAEEHGSSEDGPDIADSAELVGAEQMAGGGEAPLDMDYDGEWDGGNADLASAAGGPAGDTGLGSTMASYSGSFDAHGPDLEQTLARAVSLRDHLMEQIELDLADPVDRMIGTALLDQLDDAGYFGGQVEELTASLGCTVTRVEETLSRMQRFDPPGVFARDLKECLALQLKDRNRLDPAMQTLLDNLDLLARREAARLMKLCDVSDEDFADMVAEIRTLDPKPALSFDAPPTQPVTPDVFIRLQNGNWVVELNNETLPRVLVDAQYYARISREAASKRDKEYIAECFQSANWLVRALHQRATTILRVASEIVRQQDAFFVHGVHRLKPLVLRNIAEAIEMHESTISRVTTNKYMATPRGIFELKYFFTSAIASNVDDAKHSAESVRHRIKTLINDEATDKILSDDGIADILKNEGLDIARRTVAKYRESMRIPSSVQRRREKALHL